MLQKKKGYLLVALAAILWGTIGVQVKNLLHYQLSVQTIVLWRMAFAFITLFIYILLTNKSILKVDSRGLLYISLIGLFSQSFFNLLYFSTIERTSVATAVTLLYTSPIFISLMARVFYHERFNLLKILALFLCISGCFLTASGGSLETLQLNLSGILMGLGSGFTFALLTILSKAIIKKYHPLTIIIYSIGSGLLFYLLFSNPAEIFKMKLTPSIWLWLLLLGLISTTLAYGFYISGLSCGIEVSKAGIISTLELVVGVILSYLIFKESLEKWKWLGILMVIWSVLMLQIKEFVPFHLFLPFSSIYKRSRKIIK